ncbi:hypothetical protein [Lysinibacillus pakistanensis]|uniref:hypothetical protein n=1 Tax=Lysinibacillus pakistanensis TaxID=759811 RepID=UPI003D287630
MNWLLKKFALIAAMTITPLGAKDLTENHESIPGQSKTEIVVGNLPEANITLYAIQQDEYLKNFKLESNGNIQHFTNWINVSYEAYNPRIFYTDIDSDGNKELIIVLTTDYRTGILEQKVHVFHKNKTNIGDVYKEVLVDNPIAIILKNVKMTLTESEATITIGDKKAVINIDNMALTPNSFFRKYSLGI